MEAIRHLLLQGQVPSVVLYDPPFVRRSRIVSLKENLNVEMGRTPLPAAVSSALGYRSLLSAQDNASMAGTVTDATGAVVTRSLAVTLSNRHTGVSFGQTTDSRGSYRFAKARPAPPQQRSTYCSSRSAAASACRSCRTSRPWAEYGARNSRRCRGSAWSGRPACRRTWSAKINAEVRGMFADPEFLKTFLDHDPFQFDRRLDRTT